MSRPPAPSPRSGPARRRGWLVGASAAGVAALGIGVAGFTGSPDGARASWSGEGLRIEVVQPAPPPVAPGPRMEVGDLVDGYRHVPPRPREPAFAVEDVVAWLEPLPPLPEPVRAERPWREPSAAYVVLPAASAPPIERGPRDPYGFDVPRPDYAAARQARRERLERLERMRTLDREPSGPPDDRGWRRVEPRDPPPWRRVPDLPRDSVFY